LRHRLGDTARREILAFGIDIAPRSSDQRQVRRLDLENRRFSAGRDLQIATEILRNCASRSSGPQSPPPRTGAVPVAGFPALPSQLALWLRYRTFENGGRIAPAA
jgi:hypothetical protein